MSAAAAGARGMGRAFGKRQEGRGRRFRRERTGRHAFGVSRAGASLVSGLQGRLRRELPFLWGLYFKLYST
eukprot:8686212-Pyramimonas_sp.AAC.1